MVDAEEKEREQLMIEEKFIQFIRVERRLSESTVETYAVTLRLFRDYLAGLPESKELVAADSDNIRDWISLLMEEKHSAAYVNRSLVALRTFYKFCLLSGEILSDPARTITGPKKPKRIPRFIDEKDMDKLFSQLEEQTDDFNIVRARTIIYILYLTGLRASELLSLDDNMIDFVNKEIKVTGKRNKQRIIPFAQELQDVVCSYLALRDEKIERIDNALFVGNKGKRLTYGQLRKIVKENLSLVSTMKKLSPHLLRHTFATSMLNHDANLESIQKLLGHQSLNATEIYTHTTFEQLKRIYNEAHPRS